MGVARCPCLRRISVLGDVSRNRGHVGLSWIRDDLDWVDQPLGVETGALRCDQGDHAAAKSDLMALRIFVTAGGQMGTARTATVNALATWLHVAALPAHDFRCPWLTAR